MATETSPFDRYVRERLGELNPAWPPEFDRCLDAVRSALAELRQKGGDDRFALFVLANFRWRQVVLPGPLEERDALIEQINGLLGNQSAWDGYLPHSSRTTGPAVKEELRRARETLLAARAFDVSAFEWTSTEWMKNGAHWKSDHSYTCLWVLDWHLRRLPRVGRIRRRLLAELLFPFGFLGDSGDPVGLVAQRLHRNPRVRTGYRPIRNVVLVQLIRMYHRAHRMAHVGCGPMCEASSTFLRFTAPVEAERLTEKARRSEQNGRHEGAARYYRAALAEAERHVGADHFYLAPILVRYWLALRHAGHEATAAKIRSRVERMWEKYGFGHLSQ